MEVKQNLLVDYLVMSFKVSQEQADCFFRWLTQLLNFPIGEAESIRSYYGLPTCYFYMGIKLHYSDQLIVLDMSGKGCRACEQLNPGFDWYDFLHLFHCGLTQPIKDGNGQLAVHISRLDVACDLLGDERITLPFLQRYVQKDKFICKSTYHSCVIGNKEMAIYFGSPRSDRRLRIYDKAMEQRAEGSWVRFEFQLRNDNALSFYLNLSGTCVGDFALCYYGMLHDYLRFTEKPNLHDHNSSKLKVSVWWRKFLQGVQKIKQLYLPGNDYDISNISRVYARQCASTVRTLIQAADGDLTEIIDTALTAPLNRRQREALAKMDGGNLDDNTARNTSAILAAIGGD